MRWTRANQLSSSRGRTVVVTGAAGGIGSALSRQLAHHGADLVLLDRDESPLRAVANECSGAGSHVDYRAVDVSDDAQVAEIGAQCERVNDLFNCAGVIQVGPLAGSDIADIRHVVEVDLIGTIVCSKVFLPQLAASGTGRLCNISSGFGLVGVPGYSAYCAAKFAVRGFTEALQCEMAHDPKPVQVSLVYPGGVRTNIMRAGRYARGCDAARIQQVFDGRVARTSALDAATRILAGVARGRTRIRIGAETLAADIAARVSTAGYQRLVGRAHPRLPELLDVAAVDDAAAPAER